MLLFTLAQSARFFAAMCPRPASILFFLDPPYDLAGEYASTLGLLGGAGAAWLAEDALVIAEHRRKESLADTYGTLTRTRLLQQGDAALSFYAWGMKSE